MSRFYKRQKCKNIFWHFWYKHNFIIFSSLNWKFEWDSKSNIVFSFKHTLYHKWLTGPQKSNFFWYLELPYLWMSSSLLYIQFLFWYFIVAQNPIFICFIEIILYLIIHRTLSINLFNKNWGKIIGFFLDFPIRIRNKLTQTQCPSPFGSFVPQFVYPTKVNSRIISLKSNKYLLVRGYV